MNPPRRRGSWHDARVSGLTIDLQQVVAAPPDVVWALVAEPALMNRWSLARIESVAPGDGGHPGGVGALRRVHLPHGLGVLTEVIERALPLHLEYRVVAGAPVINHHGAIEIVPERGGSRLRWAVTATPIVPGTGGIMARFLRDQVGASLASLAAIAPGVSATPRPPPVRDLDESGPLAIVQDAAEQVALAQAALAERLLDAGDDRGWFARVYHHVTMGVLDAARAGRFLHPSWVLRLIPKFHEFFLASLDGRPEPHWARAFALIERAAHRTRFERAMTAVYAGMRAHIEDDLPRTLALIYADHYGPGSPRGPRCDYVRFRADYLRMADIFPAAGDRLLSEIPRHEWTPRARLLDRLTPKAVRIRLIDKSFYPISRERRRAFERGEGIATLLDRPIKIQ